MSTSSFSVVHLKMRFGSTELSTGSGILYLYKENYYIVTAWHNLSGRHSEHLGFLSREKAAPNNAVVSITREFPGFGGTRLPFVIPLTDDEQTFYYVHPINYPRIDVAIIPLSLKQPYELDIRTGDGKTFQPAMMLIDEKPIKSELCPIQKYSFKNEEILIDFLDNLDVTDELFIPGYPENLYDYTGQPVWKRATVASSFKTGWNREPKFLIDSASRPGMSGAPVFYYSKEGHIKSKSKTYVCGHEVVVFVGVYVGRIETASKEDAQIGIVWKFSVIDEIIDGGKTELHPNILEANIGETKDAVMRCLSKYSEEGIKLILDENADYRYYARGIVHRDLDARANPKYILECILEAAALYKGPYSED